MFGDFGNKVSKLNPKGTSVLNFVLTALVLLVLEFIFPTADRELVLNVMISVWMLIFSAAMLSFTIRNANSIARGEHLSQEYHTNAAQAVYALLLWNFLALAALLWVY